MLYQTLKISFSTIFSLALPNMVGMDINRSRAKRLLASEMEFLRGATGRSRRERIRNIDIRKHANVQRTIMKSTAEKQLQPETNRTLKYPKIHSDFECDRAM